MSLNVNITIDNRSEFRYDYMYGSARNKLQNTAMDIEFANPDLYQLEIDGKFNAGYSKAIVRAYRKVVRFIRSAIDERDFRSMRSLNFEKLKGERSNQHSLRLNQQWRLIIEIKVSTPKNVIVVIGIEDYH